MIFIKISISLTLKIVLSDTNERLNSTIVGLKWVVKAQIHSGAIGKAGGIIICNDELK